MHSFIQQMWQFRLGRTLFLVVIGAILLIEIIIIFPSYQNFKQARLDSFVDQGYLISRSFTGGRAKGWVPQIDDLREIMQVDDELIGLALFDAQGQTIVAAGEPVRSNDFSSGDRIKRGYVSATGFALYLPLTEGVAGTGLQLHINLQELHDDLLSYVLRIGGLVLIICLVAGSIVFVFMSMTFIEPLQSIHHSLQQARIDPGNADKHQVKSDRDDELGETIELLNQTLVDVAEAQRKNLAFQEQRLTDFAAAASDWFWEMDANLRFTYFSDHFEAVTGVDPSQLLGKTREETGIPGVDPKAWKQHLDDLHQHRPFRDFVHPRTKLNGEQVWVAISGVPVFDDTGTFIGFRGIGADITRLHDTQQQLIAAKEAAEQASRVKSDFLANMSHEIRTPMNGVIGMTDVLLDSGLNDEQQEYAQVIKDSGDALLSIINDILDFSKLEKEQVKLEALPFAFNEVAASVVDLLNIQAQQKELQLGCHVDPALHTQLLGDPGRLRQVLMNLVSNAIKFTERGIVDVRLTAVREHSQTIRVRCEVNDTGVGISEHAIENLFDSFTQADSSITRKFGGTGLGLAISRRLIEAMGGSIGVNSEPTIGSQFWFEVDLARA